jgi:hypothetical protein
MTSLHLEGGAGTIDAHPSGYTSSSRARSKSLIDRTAMVNLDQSRNDGRNFATIATIAGRKAI